MKKIYNSSIIKTFFVIFLFSCQSNFSTEEPTPNIQSPTPPIQITQTGTSTFTPTPVLPIQTPQVEMITNISNMIGWNFYPSWSPDGSKIIFVGQDRQSLDDGYGNNIYTTNPEGSQQTLITESAPMTDYHYPSWFPDGSSIVYVQGNTSRWTINTMFPDGSQKSEITVCEYKCTNPEWSPDGTNIIYFERQRDLVTIIKYNVSSQQKEVFYQMGNFLDNGASFSLAYSPDGSKIIFSIEGEYIDSSGTTNYKTTIYTINADRSNLKEIANATDPAWSPDGTKIIFAMSNSNGLGLYIANTDGTDIGRYTYEVYNYINHPSWSPDGKYLVFAANGLSISGNEGPQIVVMPTRESGDFYKNTGDLNNLVQNPQACPSNSKFIAELDASSQEIVWSPDMSQIAFVSSFDGDNDVYIMNSDGKNIKKITENTFDDFDITWLKDGKHLLFVTDQNSTFDLYSIELNNTNQNALKLLADNIYAYDYELSPDGRTIVYTGYNAMSLTSETIYSINLDGSNKIQLTQPDLSAGSPHWGVDGNTIYFENKVLIPRLTRSYWGDSNSMLAPQIMSMNRDGSDIKALTNSGAVDSILRISPDGQYIMFRSDRDKPDEFRTYIMNTNGENQIALVNEQVSWWPYFNKIVVFPDDPTIQPYFIDLNGNYLSELPEILKNGYRFLPDKKHVYVFGDNGETFSLCVASIPLDLMP